MSSSVVERESPDEPVEITEENFESLQSLSSELGFHGLDSELTAFKASHHVDGNRDVSILKERLKKQDKLIADLQRQLVEQNESLLQRVESLERKIAELEAREHNVPDLDGLKENEQLLFQMAAKLGLVVKPATSARKSIPEVKVEFSCTPTKPLDGIIAYLTKNCGGNVHERGIVNITASGFDGDAYEPKNVADLSEDTRFYSTDEENAWICYDFKDRMVIPESYSVRSFGYGPGGCHLKSWVVEVSEDGVAWKEIDRRVDNNDLNDRYVTRHFQVAHVPDEPVQLVRLRQIGRSHWGEYRMSFTALEVFGTLFED